MVKEREPAGAAGGKEREAEKGKMTVEEAGHLGGVKGGQKGGQRVRELVEEGKEKEREEGKD
jgi:hypothetical protein